MSHHKRLIFLSTLLLPFIANTILQAKLHLSHYSFKAGSVLPFFIDTNGIKYLILSREAHGNDRGTYDDFGGKRDYDFGPNQNNPEPYYFTPAREFFEEAILKLSIGLSLPDTLNFINIKSNNTQYVIAFSSNIAYIVDFSIYKDTFFQNFYSAFNTTKNRHSKEKDRLALVEWDFLKTTIKNNKFNIGVTIPALVLDPQSLKWNNEQITLRGFFVKKFRPFFTDAPYQPGTIKKIRFYDRTTAVPAIKPAAAAVRNTPAARPAPVTPAKIISPAKRPIPTAGPTRTPAARNAGKAPATIRHIPAANATPNQAATPIWLRQKNTNTLPSQSWWSRFVKWLNS